MIGLDSAVAQYINGEVRVIDCWSTSETKPSTDASQDFVVLGWSRNTTTTQVKFKRLMYTGDS